MSEQIVAQGKQLVNTLESLKSFQIQNDQDHAFACQQLLVVKTNAKHFKAQKETMTQPANATLKAIRDMFRPIETALEQMEEVYKQKIGAWEQTKKNQEAQALAKAAELFQSGDHDKGLALLNTVPEVAVVKQQGVSTRKVLKFRVVNPNLVPREYCQPVDALIRARVGVDGMKTSIPGVEVYEDVQVTGRV